MNKLFFVLVLLFSTSVFAEELDVKIHLGLWSHHWDQEFEPNETNDLIGIEVNGWYAAHYENSAYYESFLVGRFRELGCFKGICADYFAGAVTGYEYKTGNEIQAMVFPRVRFEIQEHLHVQVWGVPGYVVAAGFVGDF